MRVVAWSTMVLLLAACGGDDILDRDGDGQRPRAAGGTDCDDTDPTIYLGADERCGNGKDDDCDNEVDEDGVGSQPFFQDADRDGYGAPGTRTLRCELADGFADNDLDCDDTDRQFNPDAPDDECDGLDQDCDGPADDGAELRTWFPDRDGDGYGDADVEPELSCDPSREGWASVGGDCNDADPAVSPGATEACNGLDDDCDGDVDGPVIGDGRACPAQSCAEVDARNAEPAIGSFWVVDQRPGRDLARVECASVPGVGDGWMHVTLPWVLEDGSGSFDKGGARGGFVAYVRRDDAEVPLLDPEFRCATPMRWTRYQVDLPVPFTQVFGDWTMYADELGRTGMPWGGVDNVLRDFGDDSNKNDACGNGAVLFGVPERILKDGGAWGSPWAARDLADCATAAESRCRTWQTDDTMGVPETRALRWEVHGTLDNHNPATTLRTIDVFVR